MNYGTFGFSGKGSGYWITDADSIAKVGNRTIYTFTNVSYKNGLGGKLIVESSLVCDILLVGGGGGGMVGGGGGGGVLFKQDFEIPAGEYPIIVGQGGGCGYEDGRGNSMYIGSSGSHSMLGALLIAYGGGRGGSFLRTTPTVGSTNINWDTSLGVNGGSGGGPGTSGGIGAQGLGTPGQGFDGGYLLSAGADPWPGSSGGGAGAVGGNTTISGTVSTHGAGGAGKVCNITGADVTYGGGGGGSAWIRNYYGNGGSGGGGRGGGQSTGRMGTNGLGGGGGGAAQGYYSGSGGSGVVIISIPN